MQTNKKRNKNADNNTPARSTNNKELTIQINMINNLKKNRRLDNFKMQETFLTLYGFPKK